MRFPKGASIPFAKLQLAAGFKPRSRIQLITPVTPSRVKLAWVPPEANAVTVYEVGVSKVIVTPTPGLDTYPEAVSTAMEVERNLFS